MNVNANSPKPWHMFAPLASVLALAAIWSAYWLVALGMAKAESARQRDRLAADGWNLGCATESWGGYPFRFEFACISPVLRMGQLETSATAMRAYAQAYDPWHVLVLVDGPTRVKVGPGVTWTATHETARASLRFREEPQPYVSVEFPKLNVEGFLTAGHLLLSSRPEADRRLGIAMSARAFNYQPMGRPPLPIQSIEFTGTFIGYGGVKVRAVKLQEGNVTFSGSGSIELDHQRRVSGILHTETNNFDGLLVQLEPHVQLPEQQREAFRTMLSLLVRDSKVDIIARDGELYFGPFKVADLLPLY